MDIIKMKEETCAVDEAQRGAAPITRLQELELVLIGGGMGDVQQ